MVSPLKIAYHRERLLSYLDGENIFPVTLELNLTARCNRTCTDCPSTLGSDCMSLDAAFLRRLFTSLQGQTRGLIVTGGEPTISPVFPEALALARLHFGFRDIAVVTNGTCLDRAAVSEALVDHASAVRISLYDWDASSLDGLIPTLDRIEILRDAIEMSRSKLEIGVSALTTSVKAGVLERLAGTARDAGAHWIYFHPTCTRDSSGAAARLAQERALYAIRQVRRELDTSNFRVHHLEERYDHREIRFEGYHAAHFVLVIGADGMNYLATEVKYQPKYLISDLINSWRDDYLWHPARIERIGAISSEDFPAQGTRNRGVIYNTLIQDLLEGKLSRKEIGTGTPAAGFVLPHII
jgi:MoaA/NifB/PqqE/SkfB family radical SAM enzyme